MVGYACHDYSDGDGETGHLLPAQRFGNYDPERGGPCGPPGTFDARIPDLLGKSGLAPLPRRLGRPPHPALRDQRRIGQLRCESFPGEFRLKPARLLAAFQAANAPATPRDVSFEYSGIIGPQSYGIFQSGGPDRSLGPFSPIENPLVLTGVDPGAMVTIKSDGGSKVIVETESDPAGFCTDASGANRFEIPLHSSQECVFVMPNSDVSVSVFYDDRPAADVAVRWSKLPGGHAGNGGGVTVSGRESGFQAAAGAMVTIVATPNPGWDVSWNAAAGCGDGVTVCVFPASAAEVVATFDAGDNALLAKYFGTENQTDADGLCRDQSPTLARADSLVQGGVTVGYWCNIRTSFGEPFEACVQFGANYDPAATDLDGVSAQSGFSGFETFNAGDLYASGIPALCSEEFKDCPNGMRRGGLNPFNSCVAIPAGRTFRFGWNPANGGVVVATVLGGNLRPSGVGGIPSGSEVDLNAQIKIDAIPADGWYVSSWSGVPSSCHSEIGSINDTTPQSCEFFASANYNVMANFAEVPTVSCAPTDLRFGASNQLCIPATGEIENTEENCRLFGGTPSDPSFRPPNPVPTQRCEFPNFLPDPGNNAGTCALSDHRRQTYVFNDPTAGRPRLCSENAFPSIRSCLARSGERFLISSIAGVGRTGDSFEAIAGYTTIQPTNRECNVCPSGQQTLGRTCE